MQSFSLFQDPHYGSRSLLPTKQWSAFQYHVCRAVTFLYEVVRERVALHQQFSAAPQDLRGHSRVYTPARPLHVQSARRIS